MDEDLPHRLAEFEGKGYVIAPAGYGKTHLIARSVHVATARQLVLTHTCVGVDALRQKMQLLGVPATRYQIDTIASWALRSCLHFPKTSNWSKDNPGSKDWVKVYAACATLCAKPFFRRLVRCSYGGIYVDEYQDCSSEQHTLMEGASRDTCNSYALLVEKPAGSCS